MGFLTKDEFLYQSTARMFPSEALPAFEEEPEQLNVWNRKWGCMNDIGQLRTVLVHAPGDEFAVVDERKWIDELQAWGDLDEGWYWRGSSLPDLDSLRQQHDNLVRALEAEGVEVVRLTHAARNRLKSCYTRDVVIAVKGGAIVGRMGPRIRRGEELPAMQTLASIGMPVLRTVHGTGLLEGGNFAWINDKLAVLGLSTRTNEEGARQLQEVLATQGVDLVCVHLTGYQIHLDGLFVMIDADKALVRSSGLPFWFLEKLKEWKIRTIDVHPDDPRQAINCLAVAPGRVIIDDKVSRRTADLLDGEDVALIPIPYAAMYGNGGSIHCSTSPLCRDSV